MNKKNTVTLLTLGIIALSFIAAITGILSSQGSGPYSYETIRGDIIEIYGRGLYRHMKSDIAIQGIAHDYVTLFIGIPLLILGLRGYRKDSLKGSFILTGTLGFFLLTYLFYLMMAMYNELFLIYVALLGFSFFSFVLMLGSFDKDSIKEKFSENTKVKVPGIFLVINGINVGILWLTMVITPLLDGSIYPVDIGHSTTLVVQGLDLALMLPFSIITGILLIKRNPLGYIFAPSYLIFLSILMAALTAKLIAMGMAGVSIIPAIIIMPATMLISIGCVVSLMKNIKSNVM
ncbi:hypothetical protein J2Z35_000952 [Acetoanaerobium pronyense]|uniref:Uncharacterized protein n=1 Tax=Acetoanaerobium pronyense TaxID=1482736 RepID=A0ABS4KHD8_9FIRM|nr:hypothetical protein [Acetoanaerobium pronyense]MBP2027158.1 hypothetical protein [Acetoanaerobium pronyense]